MTIQDRVDMTQLPIGELEHQICELAAQIDTATGRFLEMLAGFDAREGWRPTALCHVRTGSRGAAGSAWAQHARGSASLGH